MPVNSDNYNNDAILGARIERLVQKVLQKYVDGSNVIAEMGNNFDARLKAVEDALKSSNVGVFVADSVETQSLKVGGEDVTDASNHTATFSQASSRTNLTTGEKLSAMFSKIAKWLADLKTVAFSGSYNDLSNKPTIPSSPVQSDWNESSSSSLAYIKNKPSLANVATSGSYNDLSNKPLIPAAQVNSDWNATSGVAEILNKPESKYFLWDTTSANGFGIWANIYDASDHYTAWLPICLLEDDPDTSSSNSAILHTNFSSTQQSGITVYSDAMTTAYLKSATSSHLALSKGLWYYEFAIELVPTQIVSGIANMKINIYSQVYDSPSSIPSYYMIKNIEVPTNCNVQSTYTRTVSGVIYSIRDFTFDSQGFFSSGQTLGVMFDIDSNTVPSGAAFKFRQTGLHLVKLGI